MKKPIILKELLKNKKQININFTNSKNDFKKPIKIIKQNPELDKYLTYYDDIKLPNRKYDW